MDAPGTIFVITQRGGFKAPTGPLDVFDCPYACRGITHAGMRCSRPIAESRVASLPSYTGKGLVAFWRPKSSYRNALAAYYCRQHMEQAEFRPVKISSTYGDQLRAADATTRRPLAEKSTNTSVRLVTEVEDQAEVETEEAISACRASTRQPKPLVITFKPPMIPVESVRSPTKARVSRTNTSLDSPKVEKTVIKVKEQATANMTPKQQSKQQAPERGQAKSDETELKLVKEHLLAALKQLSGQVESLTVQVALLKAKDTVVVNTQAEMPSSNSGARPTVAQTKLKPAPTISTGPAKSPEPPELSKRPAMSVEGVDLESQTPEKEQGSGWRQKVRKATNDCCGCM